MEGKGGGERGKVDGRREGMGRRGEWEGEKEDKGKMVSEELSEKRRGGTDHM